MGSEIFVKIKKILKKNTIIFNILKSLYSPVRFLYYAIRYNSISFNYLINNKKQFQHNLAIVAIVNNEAPYLKEWIEYHKLMGVDFFYIYDNYSTDATEDILQPYIDAGEVNYTLFPDKEFHNRESSTQEVQKQAYKDAITRYKNTTKWFAIIDIDEFIVPLKNNSITDLLKTYEKFNIPAIEISWVLYGYSGNYHKPDGLVIENYTRSCNKSMLRNLPQDWEWIQHDYCKSIINPRAVINYSVHSGFYIFGFRAKPMDKNVIRINHYWTKSYEELCQKLIRNKYWHPESGEKYKVMPEYDPDFLSNIEDNVMEKYAAILKEKL
jgi:hypothetical protein